MSGADANERRITALEQTIAEMREEMQALRAQIHAATDRVTLTMRGQTRCPGCGKQVVLHARGLLGLGKPGSFINRPPTSFETYVCVACGLTEWYVTEPTKIEPDGQHYRLIDGTTPDVTGPYR